MKRASLLAKARLRLLDAMTGYAGTILDPLQPEDRELLRRNWLAHKRYSSYRITPLGRKALKRFTGYTSAYARGT